jgi:hypothetical protein
VNQNAPIVLDRTTTTNDVANTTVETAIYNVSIPGGTLGTNKTLRLSLIGDYLNNSGASSNLTVIVRYGTTVLFTTGANAIAASANRRSLMVNCEISAKGLTNSQVSKVVETIGSGDATGSATQGSTYNTSVHNSIAEDSTVTKNLQVTVTHGTANVNISARLLAGHIEVL